MRVTSNSSELVIDGFPRSANSFAVQAFRFSQKRFVCMGNHVHSPCNLIRGIGLRKPVLLVIRPPKEAILAYCALQEENRTSFPNWLRKRLVGVSVRRYISFHKRLLPLRTKISVASFDEITNDFGKVIQQLNSKYGTSFLAFEHTQENVLKIFENSPHHLSPSAARSSLKDSYIDIWKTIESGTSVAKANALFNEFVQDENLGFGKTVS